MKTFKKTWDIISTILVALIVLCAVFLMGTRLLGYEVYTVISGSMEPKYSVGDLVYVKPTNFDDIDIGDDITFVLNQDLVVATHQVIRIDTEKQSFVTKGLANDIEDSPVHYKNVKGVVQFHIPLMGYVADFIQHPPGMYITIAVGAVLLILVFLPDILIKKKQAVEETDPAILDENEKLKAELEALKAQLESKEAVKEEAEVKEET